MITPNEVILEHSTQLSTCLTRSTYIHPVQDQAGCFAIIVTIPVTCGADDFQVAKTQCLPTSSALTCGSAHWSM